MIQLNEKFRINADGFSNIILEEKIIVQKAAGKTPKNEGKEVWTNIGFYSGFKSALKAFCTKDLKNSKSMEELVERLGELEKMIDKLLTIRFKEQNG